MPYFIDARLEEGGPRVEILDADSGAVRLRLTYDGSLNAGDTARKTCADRHLCPARVALHRLIKDLFLVSCAGKLRIVTHLRHTEPEHTSVGCRYRCQDRAAPMRQNGVASDVDALIVDEVRMIADGRALSWKNV